MLPPGRRASRLAGVITASQAGSPPTIDPCHPVHPCRRATGSMRPGSTLPRPTVSRWTGGRRWARGSGTACPTTWTCRGCSRRGGSSTRPAVPCARRTPTRRCDWCGSTATCATSREVPGQIHLVHQDERLVVVDKPPFLATIPRGGHVRQSVVVRLREELAAGAVAAAPAGPGHLRAAHADDRGPVARRLPDRFRTARGRQDLPGACAGAPRRGAATVVRGHIRKQRGRWCAEVVPDAPANAETRVELEREVRRPRGLPADSRARAGPTSCACTCPSLGIPIVDDPLYPQGARRPGGRLPAAPPAARRRDSVHRPGRRRPRRFASVRSLPLAQE